MPSSSSASRAPTRWVGLTSEERTAERRALLLDAAFELLGTDGYAATTVRAICSSARLNPRYFYESFDDLDACIVAVYDRLVEELREQLLATAQSAGDDPKAQVRSSVDCILRFVDDDRRRGRVLYVEALGSESLNRRRIETGLALVRLVEQAGAQRAGGRARRGEHIGRVTAAILVGGAAELVVAWIEGRIDVPREQLVDDATELFLSLGERAARLAAERS